MHDWSSIFQASNKARFQSRLQDSPNTKHVLLSYLLNLSSVPRECSINTREISNAKETKKITPDLLGQHYCLKLQCFSGSLKMKHEHAHSFSTTWANVILPCNKNWAGRLQHNSHVGWLMYQVLKPKQFLSHILQKQKHFLALERWRSQVLNIHWGHPNSMLHRRSATRKQTVGTAWEEAQRGARLQCYL